MILYKYEYETVVRRNVRDFTTSHSDDTKLKQNVHKSSVLVNSLEIPTLAPFACKYKLKRKAKSIRSFIRYGYTPTHIIEFFDNPPNRS